MPNIGPMEIVIVLIIALLILGPKKLPSAGRSLGEGIRGFRDSLVGKAETEPEPVPVQQAVWTEASQDQAGPTAGAIAQADARPA